VNNQSDIIGRKCKRFKPAVNEKTIEYLEMLEKTPENCDIKITFTKENRTLATLIDYSTDDDDDTGIQTIVVDQFGGSDPTRALLEPVTAHINEPRIRRNEQSYYPEETSEVDVPTQWMKTFEKEVTREMARHGIATYKGQPLTWLDKRGEERHKFHTNERIIQIRQINPQQLNSATTVIIHAGQLGRHIQHYNNPSTLIIGLYGLRVEQLLVFASHILPKIDRCDMLIIAGGEVEFYDLHENNEDQDTVEVRNCINKITDQIDRFVEGHRLLLVTKRLVYMVPMGVNLANPVPGSRMNLYQTFVEKLYATGRDRTLEFDAPWKPLILMHSIWIHWNDDSETRHMVEPVEPIIPLLIFEIGRLIGRNLCFDERASRALAEFFEIVMCSTLYSRVPTNLTRVLNLSFLTDHSVIFLKMSRDLRLELNKAGAMKITMPKTHKTMLAKHSNLFTMNQKNTQNEMTQYDLTGHPVGFPEEKAPKLPELEQKFLRENTQGKVANAMKTVLQVGVETLALEDFHELLATPISAYDKDRNPVTFMSKEEFFTDESERWRSETIKQRNNTMERATVLWYLAMYMAFGPEKFAQGLDAIHNLAPLTTNNDTTVFTLVIISGTPDILGVVSKSCTNIAILRTRWDRIKLDLKKFIKWADHSNNGKMDYPTFAAILGIHGFLMKRALEEFIKSQWGGIRVAGAGTTVGAHFYAAPIISPCTLGRGQGLST